MAKKIFVVTRTALLAGLLLCAGGVATAACNALAVTDAWVRATPGMRIMSGYFEVTNNGDAAVRLTAVSSPQFARAGMHESVVDDSGMARMRPVDALTLAPGETLAFAPGGYHVMLHEPRQPLAPGDTVTLTLHCGTTAATAVTAPVQRMRSTHAMSAGTAGMTHANGRHGE